MTPLESAMLKILRSPELFSEQILSRPLRPYQLAPLQAIIQSVTKRQGLTFTLMFARQMGKNETSGHLETYLLNRYQQRGGTIIKTAPTYQPQTVNSKLRLLTLLNNPLNRFDWRSADGYRISLGKAHCLFVSGSPMSQVVGLTADMLLEVDEAQDFDEAHYTKAFRPMASSTNATTVMYGTAWTGDTLLEHQIATNKDLQLKDGTQRHFQYDWQVLADISPEYRAAVEGERLRLGEDHPLFRTQYRLQTLNTQDRFLSPQHLAQLHGHHSRQSEPTPNKVYVAGIDLAGESEQEADAALRSIQPRRDSVVVTIAELDYTTVNNLVQEPICTVVEHYYWTGRKHRDLYSTLLDILRTVWGCQRVAVDASGVGAGVASFLQSALGEHVVEQFVFTTPSKSRLGYNLLSAVNGGRLKIYTQNADHDTITECWRQLKAARYDMRAQQTMNFYVDEKDGHDDFLMSLALCAHAAQGAVILPAAASIPGTRPYQNEGRF